MKITLPAASNVGGYSVRKTHEIQPIGNTLSKQHYP